MCQEFGIDVKDNIIPQIAFGFGGGIGSTGSVCGAVAGGVMALGLKLGRGRTMTESMAKLNVMKEFRRRFEAEMGSILCRELTGVDLTTTEERKKYMISDVPQRVCFPAVGTAFRLVTELVKEAQ